MPRAWSAAAAPPMLCASMPSARAPVVASCARLSMPMVPPLPPAPPVPPTVCPMLAAPLGRSGPSTGAMVTWVESAKAPLPPPPPTDCARTALARAPLVATRAPCARFTATAPAEPPAPPSPPTLMDTPSSTPADVARADPPSPPPPPMLCNVRPDAAAPAVAISPDVPREMLPPSPAAPPRPPTAMAVMRPTLSASPPAPPPPPMLCSKTAWLWSPAVRMVPWLLAASTPPLPPLPPLPPPTRNTPWLLVPAPPPPPTAWAKMPAASCPSVAMVPLLSIWTAIVPVPAPAPPLPPRPNVPAGPPAPPLPPITMAEMPFALAPCVVIEPVLVMATPPAAPPLPPSCPSSQLPCPPSEPSPPMLAARMPGERAPPVVSAAPLTTVTWPALPPSAALTFTSGMGRPSASTSCQVRAVPPIERARMPATLAPWVVMMPSAAVTVTSLAEPPLPELAWPPNSLSLRPPPPWPPSAWARMPAPISPGKAPTPPARTVTVDLPSRVTLTGPTALPPAPASRSAAPNCGIALSCPLPPIVCAEMP